MKINPKILIVDDRIENLITLETVLSDMSVDFIRASSGNEALAMILEHEFALVLIDIQIPEMDVFKTVGMMQKDKKSKILPIIFVTAIYKDDYYKIKGIESGEIDFITKPIIPEILRGKVNVFLKLYVLRKELAAEKELLSVIFRSISDGVITTDTDMRIVMMNQSAELLTGWTEGESIGKKNNDVYHIVNEETHQPCKNCLLKVMEEGDVCGNANQIILIARDGTERCIVDSGSPIYDKGKNIIGIVLVFRDISSQRKIEEELLRMKKFESVGALAGGIAHDFSNLLVPILGNLFLAKLNFNQNDEIYELLEDAEKAAIEAKDLIHQLLPVAKVEVPIKKTTSISEIIHEIAALVLRGSNVQCDFFIPEDIWPVDVDESLIGQVIQNLIINSKQAMPEGGLIKISAENIVVDEEHPLPLEAREYVKISLQDNGAGISGEHLSNIFDPYFTTKNNGRGLGLSTSYSIIKKYEGYIIADSEVGVGTTFNIYLPASLEELLKKMKVEDKIISGHGMILVMDDEKQNRKIAGRILCYLGYKVKYANDGIEAINFYKKAIKAGTPYDVVIMDLTIPGGMGGKETILKLHKIAPYAKSIVSSGCSNDPIMKNYSNHGFNGFIAKPYRIEELSRVLHELLFHRDV